MMGFNWLPVLNSTRGGLPLSRGNASPWLSSCPLKNEVPRGLSRNSKKSMLRLAQCMMQRFCRGVCGSSVYPWDKLCIDNFSDNMRVMVHQSLVAGEPSGFVLSAATSVRMPVSRSAAIHCKSWYRLTRIMDVANSDSLLNAKCLDVNNNYYMLMFQETRTDASGSAVVYALITSTSSDIMMDAVYEGGDSTYVNLLTSGFAILPCGTSDYAKGEGNGSDDGECLLTVGFRIVCDGGQPTSKLTMLSVKTKLISSPPPFRRSELALQINDGP